MGDSGGATPIVSLGVAPGGRAFGLQLDSALEQIANLANKCAGDKKQLLDGQDDLRRGFFEGQEKRDAKFREEMLAAQKTLVQALRSEFLDLQRRQTIREDGIKQELVEAQTKREAAAQLVRDKKEANAQLARDEKEAAAQVARDKKEAEAQLARADAQSVRDKEQAAARRAQDKQELKWSNARNRKASDLILSQQIKDSARDKKDADLAAARVKKDAEQAKKEAKQAKLRRDEVLAQNARFDAQMLASKQISAEVRALTDRLLAELHEKSVLKEILVAQTAEFHAQTAEFRAQTAKFDAQTTRADKQEQLLKLLIQRMDEQKRGTDRRFDDVSHDYGELKKTTEELKGQQLDSRVGMDEQSQYLASLSSMFGDVQIWTMSQVGFIHSSMPPVD